MVVAPGNHASYSIADYDYNNVEIGIRTIPVSYRRDLFSFFPSIDQPFPVNPLAIRSYIYIVGKIIFAYRIRYACALFLTHCTRCRSKRFLILSRSVTFPQSRSLPLFNYRSKPLFPLNVIIEWRAMTLKSVLDDRNAQVTRQYTPMYRREGAGVTGRG